MTDTVTLPREVVQSALMALSNVGRFIVDNSHQGIKCAEEVEASRMALRAALNAWQAIKVDSTKIKRKTDAEITKNAASRP